jgi:hypothetical protein
MKHNRSRVEELPGVARRLMLMPMQCSGPANRCRQWRYQCMGATPGPESWWTLTMSLQFDTLPSIATSLTQFVGLDDAIAARTVTVQGHEDTGIGQLTESRQRDVAPQADCGHCNGVGWTFRDHGLAPVAELDSRLVQAEQGLAFFCTR